MKLLDFFDACVVCNCLPNTPPCALKMKYPEEFVMALKHKWVFIAVLGQPRPCPYGISYKGWQFYYQLQGDFES